MQPRIIQQLAVAKRLANANVAPFPERQERKGILRRTVQLLKRHRDHYFLAVDEEVAPISVVITTLAMQSYSYCVRNHTFPDELQVLIDTIRMMPHFIERSQRKGRSFYAVWNKTTDGENFAERWNSEPKRVNAFYEWHERALANFENIRDTVGLDNVIDGMQKGLGENPVKRVIAARTDEISAARKSSSLFILPSAGLATEPAKAATVVRSNDFFWRLNEVSGER